MKILKPKELTWGTNLELESERKCHYYFRTNGDPDMDTEDIKKWINDLPAPFANATFYYDISFDDDGIVVTKSFDTMVANASKGDAIIVVTKSFDTMVTNASKDDTIIVRDIMDVMFSREYIVNILEQFITKAIDLYVIDYDKGIYIEVDLEQLLLSILLETPGECDPMIFLSVSERIFKKTL